MCTIPTEYRIAPGIESQATRAPGHQGTIHPSGTECTFKIKAGHHKKNSQGKEVEGKVQLGGRVIPKMQGAGSCRAVAKATAVSVNAKAKVKVRAKATVEIERTGAHYGHLNGQAQRRRRRRRTKPSILLVVDRSRQSPKDKAEHELRNARQHPTYYPR